MHPKNYQFDVIIVGSGIVGASIALALAKNTQLQIGIVDNKAPSLIWSTEQIDSRVSAIAQSSKKLFENLEVWSAITAKRISPYTHMQVWDGQSEIHFAAEALQEKALGYIIEDSVMRTSLLEQFKCYANLQFLYPLRMISCEEKADCMALKTDTDISLHAKLLIAADGAESWVRKQAGIEIKSWDYQHTAIVSTIETELAHQKTARQRFMPAGPLAFLPLAQPNMHSIVWSAVPERAAHLMSLNDLDFTKELTRTFEDKLGNIISASPRQSFPLKMRHAKNYVRSRLALIGDAAHTVHPLAGQGVNLGLLDAAALAEVIIDAHKKNRDFSSLATLRRYERWRKSDTLAMLAMVEGLKQLFASENTAVKQLRRLGLNITNRISFIKNLFAQYALGNRNDLPMMTQ